MEISQYTQCYTQLGLLVNRLGGLHVESSRARRTEKVICLFAILPRSFPLPLTRAAIELVRARYIVLTLRSIAFLPRANLAPGSCQWKQC
jgi:hypothetical protein